VIINFVIVLTDVSNFVMSVDILFKMLVLLINDMVSCLSSEVIKGTLYFCLTGPINLLNCYNLFNANVFIFLLLIFVVFGLFPLVVSIYWLLCWEIGVCCISFYSSIYFYLCSFNYSFSFGYFRLFVRVHWVYPF
jgi:hypothetical protein